MVMAKPRIAPTPTDKQDQHLDQRRGVCVPDRRERAPEAAFDRIDRPAFALRFLAHPLIDEDIRVNRHAQGQQYAGDAGQGQRRAEHRQPGKGQAEIGDQRDTGIDAEPAIDGDHHGDHQRETGHDGIEAGLDRVGPEAGADRALLDHLERRGQGAGAHQHGQVIRLMRAETAADLALAADDRLADDRRADDLAVQHDGEGLADMLAGEIGEALCAGEIELEMYRPAAGILVEQGGCVFEVGAIHRDLFADGDGLPLMPFGVGKPLGCGPAPSLVSGLTRWKLSFAVEPSRRLIRSGIGNAGKFDDDAPLALPSDDGFIDAGFIHAPPHDRDRLGDGVIRQHLDGIVVQCQRLAVVIFLADPDRHRPWATSRALRDDGLERVVSRGAVLVREIERDAVAVDGGGGASDAGFTEDLHDLLAGIDELFLDDGVGVDLEQQIGAALKIKAEIDAGEPGGEYARRT